MKTTGENNIPLDIIGKSDIFKQKMRFIEKIARSDKNVLILGETGTGKDLAARKIHQLSSRKGTPFIDVNCSNISAGFFESELMGHAKGAYTGAVEKKPGLLESAHEGTVFFDEIGELSLQLQAKFLRFVEDKTIRRVGENTVRKIHARFLFATNEDLQKKIYSGGFRKDLYFRISSIKLTLPPLRQRREDIPILINHFLKRECPSGGTQKVLAKEALQKLMAYDYPGNIRELQSIIERSCFMAEGRHVLENEISLDGVPPEELDTISPRERRSILEQCRWNKTEAAIRIGKSRRHIYRLIERYEMHDLVRKRDGRCQPRETFKTTVWQRTEA